MQLTHRLSSLLTLILKLDFKKLRRALSVVIKMTEMTTSQVHTIAKLNGCELCITVLTDVSVKMIAIHEQVHFGLTLKT